ncbi:hydroxyisourate hydrolase [Pararhizobium haloflavum]|uniref:hydroxyisourate hydrolase n=1 Tax=Pararhizobium haloflavum TaxID=2037914 RepID=UPI000C18D227|nr:hydroxyisourate hydrolase [Pararhizobium haloflavum]
MAGGRLTTHVLDTASGKPASGLTIELCEGHGAEATVVKSERTNADGRCDAPLLSGADLKPGRYEVRFHVGGYFRESGTEGFYDVVPVPFLIEDGAAHYHVPLLISPFGYSTYRGS